MPERSRPYVKFDVRADLPTSITDKMRGQVRFDPHDGTASDEDSLVFIGKRKDGTIGYVALNGIAVQVADVTLENRVGILDFDGTFFQATESPDYEANISPLYTQQHTLGPFHLNDVPGTAATGLTLQFFNTTTATGIGTTGSYYAPAAGKIIAAYLNADASRTAGSAVLRPTVNGTGFVLGSGNPTLDATNTLRHSVAVAWANGIAFTAGQRISCELVTSGWTPITANVTALLVIGLTP